MNKNKIKYPTKVGQVFKCPFASRRGLTEEYKVQSFDKDGLIATSVIFSHQIFEFKKSHFKGD